MSLEQFKDAALVVTPDSMDRGVYESPDEIRNTVKKMKQLNTLGYGYHAALKTEGEGSLGKLYNVAALLHADWQASIFLTQKGDEKAEYSAVVAARLFNTITKRARELAGVGSELRLLESDIVASLEGEYRTGRFDQNSFVDSLFRFTRSTNQENAWMNTVLPSRIGQPYASLAILTISGSPYGLPDTCVTQILTMKKPMHAHMHGLSDAFALPNGDPEHELNRQINILWRFNSDTEAFPLKPIRTNVYGNSQVVKVPAGWMHTVVDGNELQKGASLSELLEDNTGGAERVIKQADFRRSTSTHVYRPTRDSVDRYGMLPSPKIWIEASMLAVNHTTRTIYIGDRHAMERRLASWKKGECCNACRAAPIVAEDDRRKTVSYDQVKNLVTGPGDGEELPVWQYESNSGKLIRVQST